jgi:hypothetical protein
MQGFILLLLKIDGQIILWVYNGFKNTSNSSLNLRAIVQDVSSLLTAILVLLI